MKELVEAFVAGGAVDEAKHKQLLEALAALRGKGETSGGGQTGSPDSTGNDFC